MKDLFDLFEEEFDLRLQWIEMLGRQRILWNSQGRGRNDEVDKEFRRVCDECCRIGILLARKQNELEEFEL